MNCALRIRKDSHAKIKIIVMFQKDFRLYDNPALFEAVQSGEVLPVYIQDETFFNRKCVKVVVAPCCNRCKEAT